VHADETDELLAQRRLADARFTHQQDQATLTSRRGFERGNELTSFSLSADERGPPPQILIEPFLARPLGIG
jgi:hypothetical protein